MPRYFFDIDDGDRQFQDDEGTELPDVEAARKEAIGVFPDILRNVLPAGDHRVFASTVRTAEGRIIFRATLSLEAGWVDKTLLGREGLTPTRT